MTGRQRQLELPDQEVMEQVAFMPSAHVAEEIRASYGSGENDRCRDRTHGGLATNYPTSELRYRLSRW
jgi:hypothetical protein